MKGKIKLFIVNMDLKHVNPNHENVVASNIVDNGFLGVKP